MGAVDQPVATRLTDEAAGRVRAIAERYPDRRSALLPALYVAQEQTGYITEDAVEDIAEILALEPADVRGVASFYTMYYDRPVGRHIFQVCGTLSCALCGAEDIIRHLEEKLGVKEHETTADGMFMFEVVECLGDCGAAPVMLFGDRYYRDLTIEKIDQIIDDLRAAGR